MTELTRAVAPFALFLMLSVPLASQAQAFDDMSIDELKSVATTEHPAALYVLASKLFDIGRRDEAVFWYYAGQLRYRAHLECNPDLPPDGDPALFGALSEVIGTEINRYAFGDLDGLRSTIDAVVEWDETSENAMVSRTDCGLPYDRVVDGLRELGTYIHDNAEQIRLERAHNGLENR